MMDSKTCKECGAQVCPCCGKALEPEAQSRFFGPYWQIPPQPQVPGEMFLGWPVIWCGDPPGSIGPAGNLTLTQRACMGTGVITGEMLRVSALSTGAVP